MNIAVPKHIGFEIEIGNHWVEADQEKTAADAATALVAAHHRLYADQIGRSDRDANEFDGDGFRFYLDHAHAEICSPLVTSAAHLVKALRDARRIVARCKRMAEEDAASLRVSYNTTNRQDVAWAFHLNVLVSRRAFDDWRDDEWAPLRKYWVPFLVTSLPLFGTGKVGAENGTPPCVFQLMQRSDFVSHEVGLETVDSKSLINIRDEPLADPDRYARLHVIAWDTNLMEFATWLKFGISQILLALIEEGVPMPDTALDNPLRALQAVSRDLSLRENLRLKNGRHETALGVQRRLAEAAATEVQKGCAASTVPDANLIVAKWIETLDELEIRRARLSRRLDWCAKLNLLRRAQELGKADREKMLLLDLQYAEVGGIFEKLENAGAVDRVEDFLPRKTLTQRETGLVPREQARAVLISRFPQHLASVDWDHVVGRDETGTPWFIPMDDPLGGRDLLEIVIRAEDWPACLRRLIKTGLATQAVTVCAVGFENRMGSEGNPMAELSFEK